MKIFDGRYLVYDSVTRFKASDITAEALESLGGTDLVSLRIHEDTGLLLPYMKKKDITDKTNHSINNWFRDMIQNADKAEHAKKMLAKRFTAAGLEYTDEDIKAIVEAPIKAKAQKDSSLEESLLKYTVGDREANTALQKRILVDDVEYPHSNETVSQIAPGDTVKVRLPDSDIITTHTIGEEYDSTPVSTVFTPYPNRIYRTKQIAKILSTIDPKLRRGLIESTIEDLTKVYKISIDDKEKKGLLSAFKLLPIEEVLGNPDNDTAEIFDNEKEFYDNLVEFIKYHIKNFNKEIMTSASEEEIAQKSKEDFAKGNLPVRLSEYLQTLLSDALQQNFYHTGNFNFKIGDFDDPDNDTVSDTISDSMEDKTAIIVQKDNHLQSDLDVIAADYLSRSGNSFGAQVWAEGIIKALRWGDRKVRNLNVGTNNTQYLDMQSLNFVTQQLADLSKFEVETDHLGRSLQTFGVAYCDFLPEGTKRLKSYPFLLVSSEFGDIPGMSDSISVSYASTLFEIVKSYLEGKPVIYDILFEDGKFKDEDTERDNLTVLQISDLVTSKCKTKVPDELTDFAINNNVTKLQGPANAVILAEAVKPYESSEPLLPRLADVAKTLRGTTVLGGLLSVFNEGAADYDSTNLVQLLNWYYNEIYPTHLDSYNNLFGFENNSGKELNTKNLKTAQFFTEADKETDADVEVPWTEERELFMHPIYEGEPLAFGPIVKSAGATEPIGGYAVNAGGRVFAALDEIPNGFAVNATAVPIGGVLLNMFEVMVTADTGNGYGGAHKVVSDQSIFKIYAKLREVK